MRRLPLLVLLLAACSSDPAPTDADMDVAALDNGDAVVSTDPAPFLDRGFYASVDVGDVVFVMEKRHREMLLERYGEIAREKEIVVLDVPDEWEAEDPELVAMLDRRIREELARWDVEAPTGGALRAR